MYLILHEAIHYCVLMRNVLAQSNVVESSEGSIPTLAVAFPASWAGVSSI